MRKTQNIKYWTEFCDYLKRRGSQLHSPMPTSKEMHHIYFRIGTGGVVRARQVIKPSTEITVAFVMEKTAKLYFHSLKAQQAEIEEEFGEPLQWWFLEWKQESHISLKKVDMDPKDEQDWSNQHEWIASKLERLNDVFRPHIKRLTRFKEQGE